MKSLLMAKLAKFLFLREKRCNLVPSKLQNNEYNHSQLDEKEDPYELKYTVVQKCLILVRHKND